MTDLEEVSDSFYRGISSPDHITIDGYVCAGAFQFDAYDANRRDGYCELSINWNDDEKSLDTLLNQHKSKKEDKQFKGGYCQISLSELNRCFKNLIDREIFSYERYPIVGSEENDYQDNPYHGNLLLKDSADKQVKKNVQHTLAFIADIAVRR